MMGDRARFSVGDEVLVTLAKGRHVVVAADPDCDGDIVLRMPTGSYGLARQVHCSLAPEPLTEVTVLLTDAEVAELRHYGPDGLEGMLGGLTGSACAKLATAAGAPGAGGTDG